jgi:hypothetical protein
MPRETLDPASPTTRINFKLPLAEAERFQRHARDEDEGNVSRMIRRLVKDDIRRSERAARRKLS